MVSFFKRRETRQTVDESGRPHRYSPEQDSPIGSAHALLGDAPTDPGGIEGYIDLVDGERVVGWAYDAASPGRRLLIEISAADAIEVVLANVERHDLRDAGKGDGRHGFEAKLDIASTGAAVIHVRIVATGQDLVGSPASTDFAKLVVEANDGKGLEYLKSEAQLALFSLKGAKKR